MSVHEWAAGREDTNNILLQIPRQPVESAIQATDEAR